MLKFVSSCVRPALLGLVLLGIAAPAAKAGSLKRFAGSGVGVLLISQGSFATVGSMGANVKASARSAKFVLKCTISQNGVSVTKSQTITLKNGRATVDHILPVIDGFQNGASGSYKLHGSTVRVTAPFSGGTLYMEIDTTTFGSTLRISEQIVYTNGNLPIYTTIIGS